MIYISATNMETRLADARHIYEDDDSWTGAAKREAYDTAIDVATCYPVPAGDIWITDENINPDIGERVLCATDNKRTLEALGPVIGTYREDGFELELPDEVLDRIDSVDDIEVYAWAYMPTAPEVP